MRIVSARFFLVCALVLIVGSVLSMSLYMFTARASVSNFYATSCLGGWVNTHLAEGAPEVNSSSELNLFTEINSAKLNIANTAQIYCGGFTGDISKNTIPKKILVKFSWSVSYPELTSEDNAPVEIWQATSTGKVLGDEITVSKPNNGQVIESVPFAEEIIAEDGLFSEEELLITPETLDISENLSEDDTYHVEAPLLIESVPDQVLELAPEPAPEVMPTSKESTVSLLDFFVKIARAQEFEVAEGNTVTSEFYEIASTTNSVIATPNFHHRLAEVLYTLDGVEWKSLGFVEKDDLANKQFEIPITEASQWEDISKIQIAVQSFKVLDGVVPTIYLDSIWIEAEYGFLEDKINPEKDSLHEESVQEVTEDDQIFEEVLEINKNLISNELNLKTRTFNDFVVDDKASHYCASEEFSINITEGYPVQHSIAIFGATAEQKSEMVIGSLPRGVDVHFSENNNYEISLVGETQNVGIELNMQEGAQIGNFTIPVIYSLTDSGKLSSVVCQINVVNI